MAKETRTVTYAHSMEQIGGALERALLETGWNLDALERSDGHISAGKRGWLGYRTIEVTLDAKDGETIATFQVACRTSEFQEMMAVFERTLSN